MLKGASVPKDFLDFRDNGVYCILVILAGSSLVFTHAER
jgi:hypothetical protein